MRRTAIRWGFTLPELMISMGAASLLTVGIATTVYVTGKATDPTKGPARQIVEGSLGVERIVSELQYAITFTERTSRAVTFTVADRNGDQTQETIRFAWSGTGGDPVTRSYNGGTPSVVARNVYNFDLSYLTQTVTESTESSGAPTESGETLLAYFDGWSGGGTTSTLSATLSSTSWLSECFYITWPPTTGAVKITRVRLQVSKSLTGGQYSVGIYPAAGGTGPIPESSPIGTLSVQSSSSLGSSASWVDFYFTDVSVTNQSVPYNIVAKGVTTNTKVYYLRNTTAPIDDHVAKWTTNSGSAWNPTIVSQENQYDAPFYVYGTYTVNSTQTVETSRYFVRAVGLALQVGQYTTDQLSTAVDILNAPEVATP